MDERRIDLSPLDPGSDPERFERMVRAVLDRAGAPAPHPWASALVDRGRAAVLAAVVLAGLAWIPALAGKRSAAPASTGPDAVAVVAAWAETGAIPDGVDVFLVLGVNDAR